MRKTIGKALIVIGILIVGISIYTTYKVEKSNDDMVRKYENNLKINVNKENTENLNIDENIVGILDIPKINIKVVVQEGTDMNTLKYAVGHFSNTQLPGEMGNFAVAGHRAYTHNKFFSDLDKVEIGDELNVLTSKGEYKYKVTSSKVIKPEQMEVLNSDFDKETITLITCTPKYIGSHRLVISGERI